MASGLVRLATRLGPPAVAVLAYHSVQTHPEAYADTIGASNIHAVAEFERQMEQVGREFNPVTLDDVLLFLSGKKPALPRSVAVTFDDGYADNCEIAAPVLERFGVRGTFYVTVGSMGGGRLPWFIRLRYAFHRTRQKSWRESASALARPLGSAPERHAAFIAACSHCARKTGAGQEEAVRCIELDLDVEAPAKNGLMMTWDQVRKLRGRGHSIGSHTLTHPNLAYVGEAEAYKELQESKRKLEEELGAPVLHFSYPHPALEPNWTERTMAMSREAGFRSAVTTHNAPVRRGANPWALPRLYTLKNQHDFLWHVERAFLPLSFR